MSVAEFAEWQAFYLIDASDQDPEVTEWDDEASALRKLNRTAKAKEETRAKVRR